MINSIKDVKEGATLPELAVSLTASQIVAGAIATHDFERVHHDKAYAQQTGVPDIFMNILTTNGFVGRFVSDWAGPKARVREVEIRLGAPNIVGDTMRLTGKVESVQDGVVVVSVSGKNSIGEHVRAKVTLGFGEQA